jgi:Tol biopolymer transport system component
VTLKSGARLGPYEVLAAIGAGGMGEVYKARDTRLDRTVAIKILPETLAADPQFRERFDREARTISQLDHPHICTLYDVGEQHGTSFLVMQYLEGETLEARLKKGALPLDRALEYAIQIADALATAHKAGIVHRDLKPGNVMLTKSGAKLLDFGLAKTGAPVIGGVGLSMLPTTPPITQQGSILGTFQYMAPEQLEGQEADARTDIFAFGAVAYEMITGKKAFDGKSQASLIGAIMGVNPPLIASLQPLAPPLLDHVVTRCLAKDPDARWQSASDLMRDLKWIAAGSPGQVPAPLIARMHRERLAWALFGLACLATATLGGVVWFRRPPVDGQAYRTSVLAPQDTSVTNVSGVPAGRFALSPDGRFLAFSARGVDNRALLWVRRMDALVAQPLLGTDNAAYPFWSPDSKSIAFFADGKLKRIGASGGPVLTVSETAADAPGAWNRDNTIVFTPWANAPLHRISASGGASIPVTTLDAVMRHVRRIYPSFLPDGRHFLYFAVEEGIRPGPIYVGSLDPAEKSKLLIERGSVAKYGQGYLLFTREGTLMAQAFDTSRLTLSGEAVSLADQVDTGGATGVIGAFSVSETGPLVYQTGSYALSQLTWFDRSGKVVGTLGMPGDVGSPAISPDGDTVAVQRRDGLATDIWLYDLVRGTNPRFTFSPGNNVAPVWSPDGSRLAFTSQRDSPPHVYQKAISGTATEEVLGLAVGDPPGRATGWSRDGRYLIEQVAPVGGKTGIAIWVLPLGGNRKPFPFLEAPFNQGDAKLSPNGQWLAYASDETKRPEVYVQTFPTPGGKWQVSTSGGRLPVWSRDGKELFYMSADFKLMAVEVRSDRKTASSNGAPRFEVGGLPIPLFSTRARVSPSNVSYDVSPDGRFLVRVLLEQATSTPLTVVVNWPALLKK